MKYLSCARLSLLLSLQIVRAATPTVPVAPTAMVVDHNGNIYVAGSDNSGTIPATIGKFHFNTCSAGLEGQHIYTCYDGFVMKLDPTGTRVIYATYIGGSGDDGILYIAVDAAGNAYVTGTTYSLDFPITPGALQRHGNVFVAKLNGDGSLNYSTYLGGSTVQSPSGIRADAAGNAYVAGSTSSGDVPVSIGAFRRIPGPGFVSKINPTGTVFVYSTYLDAAPAAMALNANGSVYITGHTQGLLTTTPGALQSKPCGSDCSFVTELSQDGTGLIYSTFLGGNAITQASSIALDPSGSVWVAGDTTSTDFPSPSPQGGAFVVKINASGTGITGSLLFAGSLPSLLGFDELGNAYVAGTGTAGTFSVTPNALLSAPCFPSAGDGQALLKLDSAANVLYASFVRQVVYTPAVLPSGAIQGIKEDPHQGYNVSTIDVAAAPKLNFSCPVNGASWRVPDSLAPGEIVSIFGSNLGPEAGATGQLDVNGRVSSSLAGTQVLFNGIPAPLLYVQSGQINAVVPFEVNQTPACLVTIQIKRNGESAPALDVRCGSNDPGVFTVSGQPGTQGAILNQDGTLNSPAHPAKLGSIVSLFATGIGALTPPGIDGQISPIPPPWITLAGPVTVTFAGISYTDKVVWAGAAPTLVAGVTQVNVQIPASLPPGTPLSAVPVSIGPSLSGPFSTPVLVSVTP